MNTAPALDIDQARTRLDQLTVIDVRTPGEYASGHLPGALNIPLDQLRRALPELTETARRGEILVVCASGARSESACALLADRGITSATLVGGTNAWAAQGQDLARPTPGPAGATRGVWAMERQVRFTAGSLVLLGIVLGLLHPAWLLLSAGIAAGLVFSALTNTCGMAVVLGKLPHNRPKAADLSATLDRLRQG
ncbi:rhodanese-like domain-containing protein [Streptomyces albipurpureus]|uniref:Rhodanese-like domain-containing protein n=1 Tax=Streptomyces albipurpureus TaxID=2897419 RepID=A0ABT0USD9_9ACTN|nr:rhodanese-like domain-containing protein [Streptomyces sp. CWNU-1]MCM2391365.1 rhodanese-like domain-containing protein [Streptomyces sp. CWNU-1]